MKAVKSVHEVALGEMKKREKKNEEIEYQNMMNEQQENVDLDFDYNYN